MGGTLSIAAFTIGLVTNPFLKRLSTSSLFVRPEHDHAILTSGLEPRRAVRKKVRMEFSLLTLGLLKQRFRRVPLAPGE